MVAGRGRSRVTLGDHVIEQGRKGSTVEGRGCCYVHCLDEACVAHTHTHVAYPSSLQTQCVAPCDLSDLMHVCVLMCACGAASWRQGVSARSLYAHAQRPPLPSPSGGP